MRILFATDLLQSADRARGLLRRTDLPKGTEIFVLMVGEGHHAEARALQLEAVARSLERPGVAISSRMVNGHPAREIADQAAEVAADLIVVGSRGRGALATSLHGSVSAEVVDHAPCPVLVARTASADVLLVADDGSPGADRAIDFLRGTAIFSGAQVDVVSVVDPEAPGASTELACLYPDAIGAARMFAAERSRRTARILSRAGYHTREEVTEGRAAARLVDEAGLRGTEVIVVGSRGDTGLRRLVVGSVARSVLTHAQCSVLVVHAKDRVPAPPPGASSRGYALR